MSLFKNYKNCIYCRSSSLKKLKNQFIPMNFYLEAIMSDLKITKNQLKKMKIYECENCNIIQNNPWFSEDVSRKIYSNIYGQHNRSWTNLINFIKKGQLPDHGNLFNLLNKYLKIKNYAEFNSPFMGIFLNFFSQEYNKNLLFYKNYSENLIKYLTSRQVAGKLKKYQQSSLKKSKKFLDTINTLKIKNLKKKITNKYLFIDNSTLSWGQNDNYKSVNSKSFASEFFDLKILDTKNKHEKIKIDLFGIFHTLDHTFKPSEILNLALNISKCVIVYCHVNNNLEKQHLFSFTNNFLKYLKKRKIHTVDLTNIINKVYKNQELYFLCSREKKYINKFLH
jgi:hypothetical protein